jgi:hypothetical protein
MLLDLLLGNGFVQIVAGLFILHVAIWTGDKIAERRDIELARRHYDRSLYTGPRSAEDESDRHLPGA